MPVEIDINHPFLKDRAILPNIELELFVNKLRKWNLAGQRGALVKGESRVGKTEAILFAMRNMEIITRENTPCAVMTHWDASQSSLGENRYFSSVLEALGHSASEIGTAVHKRWRARDFIAQRAASAGTDCFYFFVDDAHYIVPIQLGYLSDLHNDLRLKDVRLITILVGQPELEELRAKLRSRKLRQLLGRFMGVSHTFSGVKGEREFTQLAVAIDEKAEYPVNSGISFTAHFAPEAFEAGWRLADNASSIWHELERILMKEGTEIPKEFTMQAVMAIFKGIALAISDIDSSEMSLERDVISDVIYESALEQIQNSSDDA